MFKLNPKLTYRQLCILEQLPITFDIKYEHLLSRKCVWKCLPKNCGHFVQAQDGTEWERPLGPVSISENTSYCQISWSLEATRLVLWIVVSLWKLTGTSAAMLPKYLSNFRAIGNFNLTHYFVLLIYINAFCFFVFSPKLFSIQVINYFNCNSGLFLK